MNWSIVLYSRAEHTYVGCWPNSKFVSAFRLIAQLSKTVLSFVELPWQVESVPRFPKISPPPSGVARWWGGGGSFKLVLIQ